MKRRPINKRLLLYELSRIGKSFLAPSFYGRRVVPIKPTFVSLEVEDSCFFRCQHCHIWKKKGNSKRMTLEEMKGVIIDLKKWLGTFQLNLTGGEPFLNREVLSLIEFASRQGILVHTNSNGFLINKKQAQGIIKSGLNSLSISLDSLRPNVHNQLKGTQRAFKRAVKALRLLNSLRQGKKPFLSVTTIIMKQNLDELENLIHWVKNEGLDAIFFQALWQNFGDRYEPLWFKSSNLWPGRVKKLREVIERLRQMKKEGYPIGNTESDLQHYQLYFASPLKFGEKFPCLIGVNNFNIDISGEVRLCFSFPSVGNILKEKPSVIWRGKKAQEQRLRIADCKRGCKILLCNTLLDRKNALSLLLNSAVVKMKKFLRISKEDKGGNYQ